MQEQNGDTAPRFLVIEVNAVDENFRRIVLLFFFQVFPKSYPPSPLGGEGQGEG